MPDLQTISIGAAVLVQIATLFLLVNKFTVKKESSEIGPQPFAVRNDVDPVEKFAPRIHEHSQYLTRGEHESSCATRSHQIEKLEQSINHLSSKLETGLQAIDKKADDRSRRLHERIDGLVQPLNQLIGKFENHMESHRKRGES
jgi:DNA anti-recombination protein RmuC